MEGPCLGMPLLIHLLCDLSCVDERSFSKTILPSIYASNKFPSLLEKTLRKRLSENPSIPPSLHESADQTSDIIGMDQRSNRIMDKERPNGRILQYALDAFEDRIDTPSSSHDNRYWNAVWKIPFYLPPCPRHERFGRSNHNMSKRFPARIEKWPSRMYEHGAVAEPEVLLWCHVSETCPRTRCENDERGMRMLPHISLKITRHSRAASAL